MKGLAAHFAYEFRTGMRDRSLLLINYLFPLSFYLIVTMLMTQLNPAFPPNAIPAMVVFTALTSLILGLPNPLVSAREAGIFRSYRVNGIPALSALLVPALTTSIHALIGAFIVTVTAPLLFQAPTPANWGGFAIFALLNVLVASGLGVLIGVISANVRITILWSQLVFLPSIMLGGIMVPKEALTGLLAKVGGMMPSTHLMVVYNGMAMGKGPSAAVIISVLVLLATGLLAFLLASYLFSWDSQNSTRRGSVWLGAIVLVPLAVGTFLLS